MLVDSQRGQGRFSCSGGGGAPAELWGLVDRRLSPELEDGMLRNGIRARRVECWVAV